MVRVGVGRAAAVVARAVVVALEHAAECQRMRVPAAMGHKGTRTWLLVPELLYWYGIAADYGGRREAFM